MIDLHCHILPGIDDGPKTLSESLEMTRIFEQSDALGFLMAGAHRRANNLPDDGQPDTADVAKLTNSIFHRVHQEWNGDFAENIAWQIHGLNRGHKHSCRRFFFFFLSPEGRYAHSAWQCA